MPAEHQHYCAHCQRLTAQYRAQGFWFCSACGFANVR